MAPECFEALSDHAVTGEVEGRAVAVVAAGASAGEGVPPGIRRERKGEEGGYMHVDGATRQRDKGRAIGPGAS